ncbi:MAG TPA: hypothetical protein VMF89_25090, partial [Polyangiales bacterium]|nr:hypothetical protein [Polyangiales bacterium]
MNTVQRFGVVAAGWLLTCALGVSAPIEAHAADKAAGAKPAKLPPPTDPKVQAKINHYVEIMNRESKSVFDARKNWYSQLPAPNEGP